MRLWAVRWDQRAHEYRARRRVAAVYGRQALDCVHQLNELSTYAGGFWRGFGLADRRLETVDAEWSALGGHCGSDGEG